MEPGQAARSASAIGDYGTVVRLCRNELGWSQARLGAIVGYGQPEISRLERGKSGKVYDVRLLRRIAKALDIPGHLLGVVVHSVVVEEEPPVKRREFITGTAALALTAAQLPKGIPNVASAEPVEWLWGSLRSHLRADRVHGASALIDTVSAQYGTVRRLVDTSVPGTALHHELLRLGTAYADFAGWLALEAGDTDKAAAWRSQGLELALRSGNSEVTAYSLQALAMVAVDRGDGARAVDLGNAAVRLSDRLPARAKVMAMEQAAHGHALLGDRETVDRLFGAMPELLGQYNDDGEHPWGGNRFRPGSRVMALQLATCYSRLGAGSVAADLWASALDGYETDYRDRGVYLARWARALVDADAPDDALTKATEGVEVLRTTGSARLRREFATVRTAAQRIDSAPGRDLAELLRAV